MVGIKMLHGLSLKASNLEEFKTIINKELENYKEDLHIEPITLGNLMFQVLI